MQICPCRARDKAALRRLYTDAFPPEERKPFALIEEKARAGHMEILSVVEKDTFLGLAITILYGDLVLLDYFAIDEGKRGRSVGSRALAMLYERYPGKRLIVEIEDPQDPAPNTAERIRRRAFYHRNGMREMPFRIRLFGVPMLVLCNQTVTFSEYHAIFGAIFSEKTAQNVSLLS